MVNNILFINSSNESLTSYILINNAGSLRDKVPGTAHFLEHMLAGPNEEKSKKMRQQMDDYLFEWNAETNLVSTKYFIDTSPYENDIYVNYLKEFYRVLKAVKYKEEWIIPCIEHERKIIAEEIVQTDTSDHKKYFAGLEMLYGKHGNTNTTGTEESISEINIDTLSEYVNDYYTKNNVFFVIYAPEEYKDEILTEVSRIYEDLLSDNTIKLEEYSPEVFPNGTVIPYFTNAVNFRITMMNLYSMISKITNKSEIKTELLIMLIVHQINDKFFKYFREEMLLCYNRNFFQTSYGVFEFTIFTKDSDTITHETFKKFLESLEIKEEDINTMLRKYRKKKQLIPVGEDLGLAEHIVSKDTFNIHARPSDWEDVIYELSTEIKNDDKTLKQQLFDVSTLFVNLLKETEALRLILEDPQ